MKSCQNTNKLNISIQLVMASFGGSALELNSWTLCNMVRATILSEVEVRLVRDYSQHVEQHAQKVTKPAHKPEQDAHLQSRHL